MPRLQAVLLCWQPLHGPKRYGERPGWLRSLPARRRGRPAARKVRQAQAAIRTEHGGAVTTADGVTPAKSEPQARRPSPRLAAAPRVALLGTAHGAEIGTQHDQEGAFPCCTSNGECIHAKPTNNRKAHPVHFFFSSKYRRTLAGSSRKRHRSR